MLIELMNKGNSSFLPCRNFVLKHHVFLVRNWEKIRQKQEEVKHTSDNIHSASLYTRWNGICRDDGNIKSGKAWKCSYYCHKIASEVILIIFKQSIQRFSLVWTKKVKIQLYKHQSAITCPSQLFNFPVSTLRSRKKPPSTASQTSSTALKLVDMR